ncbi:MAG: hypothetical protein JMN24_18815 [gamma proteobacterium endosymbiont of Lamellibrachia anaximandri]|nr:hypothetical protein [gamma proteobacterium endosymbiont of Lamellibrachia anaximandri]MBL3619673.1 hypothetical protein [gamma proteobacterium endosymbiont of Lamellibrachia anaximandri]
MIIDLENIMKLDMSYPGISFGYHSWALGAYLDSLENFIGIAKEQYRTRVKHELRIIKDEIYSDEHYQQKLREVDEAADEHIPRYARMAAIVPLWGIFELTVTDITQYVAQREKVKIKQKEIKAGNILEQIQKYYDGILDISLPWSKIQLNEIALFYKIRNAIAHRNGEFGDDTPQRKREIKDAVSKLEGVTMRGHQLEVSSEYIKASSELVFSMITSLNQMVSDRYDGPTI